MKIYLFAATALCSFASVATAQAPQAATPTPVEQAPVAATYAPPPVTNASLPANTEIMLRMNDELTTKGGKLEVGHMFRLSVVDDVRLGDAIVIPRGSPAFGEVTWKTGKGAFGKSGKMEVKMRYIDLNGRRIPLSGEYRQEGEGNTVATVAAVVAVGVFGAFVTGKSAVIPQGRELKAHTIEALPVVLPAVAPVAVPEQSAVTVTPAAIVQAN
jgi:hypothetical protein